MLPQPGFRQGGVRVYANATVLDDGAATCAVPPVVTAGNTTVCVARDDADCFGTTPKKFASPFGYAFVDHYAAFAPAFDRRPYVREASGALLVSVDGSLVGKGCRVSASTSTTTLVDVAHTFADGAVASFGFSLDGLPASYYGIATIEVACGEKTYAHERALHRAPPPPAVTSVVVTQVDHERRALLRDGVPFAMSGWFAGHYSHISAGLPVPGDNFDDGVVVRKQASLVAEWGKQGHTFVRSGGFSNLTHGFEFLDDAHAAGLAVLCNVEVDKLARAVAKIPDSHTGIIPDYAETWAAVRASISAFKDHPAVGGWYACDDCCHMTELDAYGPAEYVALAKIKALIYELDPYHVMFGTVACGETWYWSEEAAGLGIDVVMKEAYGGGMSTMAAYREFPMTYEPLVGMPDPHALGSQPAVEAHAYLGALTAGMFHTNFFVYNPVQAVKWSQSYAASRFAAMTGELLPSFFRGGAALDADAGGTVNPATGGPVKIWASWYAESELCGHAVVVNSASIPTAFAARLPPAVGTTFDAATRIFDEAYDVTLVGNELRDFLDARQAKVYRLGCVAPAPDAANLVAYGDFEQPELIDLNNPGQFFTFRPGASGYDCHNTSVVDDRCRVTSSTAAPKSGRYAAKVNLAGGDVQVFVPLLVTALNASSYAFTYSAMASPGGIALTPGALRGKILKNTCGAALTTAWATCVATVAFDHDLGDFTDFSPLFFSVKSHVAGGGALFLDDLDLRPSS